MFDFGIVTKWINDLLLGVMPQWLATTIECALVGVALLLMYSVIAIIYIFYERKVCGWIQCRHYYDDPHPDAAAHRVQY